MAGQILKVAVTGLQGVLGSYYQTARQETGSLTDDDDQPVPKADQKVGLSSLAQRAPKLYENSRRDDGFWSDNFRSRDSQHQESVIVLEPRVCHICAAALLPSPLRYKGFRDPPLSYGFLESRANSGCRICQAFRMALLASMNPDSPREDGQVSISKTNPGGSGAPPCLELTFSGYPEDNNEAYKRTYKHTMNFELDRDTIRGACSQPSFDLPSRGAFYEVERARTISDDTIEIAREWLQICQSHDECKTSYYQPTRLLEINLPSTRSVRLRRGVNLPEDTKYMTLSHCWGESGPFKLVLGNIDEMECGVSIDVLPKTFQEALTVTHMLGVRYLWIDALCIVQDDLKDWKQESVMMGMVYSNSFCNISATASGDSSKGLFFARDVRVLLRNRIQLDERSGCIAGVYYPYNPDAFNVDVNNAPLNRRGWVLQERLLSRRNLHFSFNQLYWECCRITACEKFPRGMPTKTQGADTKRKFATMLSSPLQHVSIQSTLQHHRTHEEMHKYWGNLIEIYCNSKLTRASDRLVAISGLAPRFFAALQSCNMFLAILGQPTYLAGLWNHDLPSQLLWKVCERRDFRLGELPMYIAPSWSWASLEAEFETLYKPLYNGFLGTSEDLISIENASISLSDPLAPFGQVVGGYLEINGKLARVPFEANQQNWNTMSFGSDQSDDQNLLFDKLSLSWDAPKQFIMSNFAIQTVYLLPVRVRAKDHRVISSVLTCMDKAVKEISKTSRTFRDAYLEGLILMATDCIVDPVEPATDFPGLLPNSFKRVGHWETLAVKEIMNEINVMDRFINSSVSITTTGQERAINYEIFPSYTVMIC